MFFYRFITLEKSLRATCVSWHMELLPYGLDGGAEGVFRKIRGLINNNWVVVKVTKNDRGRGDVG